MWIAKAEYLTTPEVNKIARFLKSHDMDFELKDDWQFRIFMKNKHHENYVVLAKYHNDDEIKQWHEWRVMDVNRQFLITDASRKSLASMLKYIYARHLQNLAEIEKSRKLQQWRNG